MLRMHGQKLQHLRGRELSEVGVREPDRPGREHGIANMRRRLAEIGGSCEIQSAPGQGTRIRFVVPVAVDGLDRNQERRKTGIGQNDDPAPAFEARKERL